MNNINKEDMEYKSFKESVKEFTRYDFTLSLIYASFGVDKFKSEFDKFSYASVLRSCGKFSQAEKIINLIQQESIPDKYHFRYFLELGFLYFEWGKYELAKINFNKSIELNPDSTVPFVFLSNILLKEEKIEESIQVLMHGAQMQGDLDEVYYNLGTRYAMMGEYSKSLEAFLVCKGINPDFENLMLFIEDIEQCLKLKNKTN